jgi:branched-chain amino acid transport system permease protein
VDTIIVGTFVLACIYSLQAVSFVLLLRCTGVLNFAQGQLLALGAYFFYEARAVHNLPYLTSTVVAVLATAACGLAVYLLALRRFDGAPTWSIVMALFGIAEIANGIIGLIWGANPLLTGTPITSRPITAVGLRINSIDLLVSLVSLAFVLLALAVTYGTPLGLRMRAAAENRHLATYTGVRVGRIASITWSLSAAMAAIAGIGLAMRTEISPDLTNDFLTAFPAVLIGGAESLFGAVLGSVLLAALLTVVSTYYSGDISLPLAYAALLAVLVVRPQGLLGARETVRL